jgi:ankyrin repeat protein
MSRSLGTNVTDRDRKLQAAVRENQPHLVRNLLEAGADPDTEEPFGAVLSIALLRNFVTVARLLVEAGADVNISDHKGWTPLHWAAKIGDQTLPPSTRQGWEHAVGCSLRVPTDRSAQSGRAKIRQGIPGVAKAAKEPMSETV